MACGGLDGDSETAAGPLEPGAPVPVFTVGEPTLSIGVVEGDPSYAFEAVRDSRRLDDGTIAVADASGRISIFDEGGTFLKAFGRRGEGPGEFGALSRIYPWSGDSLAAADQRTHRVSVFDRDGAFERQVHASELSGDTAFTLDVWPRGRFLVTGALYPNERTRAQTIVDALPAPYGPSLSRMTWWPGNGELWVRDGWEGEASDAEWLVLDDGGQPVRWVDLPRGFVPHQLSGDEVIGKQVGEFDVDFVHVHRLASTGEERVVPDWMTTPMTWPDSLEVDTDALLAAMRGSIKYLASAQEIHYSQAYTYTANLDSLGVAEMELPEGFDIQILSASARGWAMVATLPTARQLCTLGYGYDTPAGWRGGFVRCGG